MCTHSYGKWCTYGTRSLKILESVSKKIKILKLKLYSTVAVPYRTLYRFTFVCSEKRVYVALGGWLGFDLPQYTVQMCTVHTWIWKNQNFAYGTVRSTIRYIVTICTIKCWLRKHIVVRQKMREQSNFWGPILHTTVRYGTHVYFRYDLYLREKYNPPITDERNEIKNEKKKEIREATAKFAYWENNLVL